MLIGKRKRAQDDRQVWNRETDFSDWLVSADGSVLPAEELGIEIENLTRKSRRAEHLAKRSVGVLGWYWPRVGGEFFDYFS
ncbi:MAG: hypothetical protein JNM85_05130 [Chthonomonas sp.]|nr:hypothetical protein [Chthonomonas sp.]